MTARVFSASASSKAWRICCASPSVRKALHSRRELFKFVSPEVTVSGAGRQNQVVVGHRNVESVCAANKHTFLVFVDARDLALKHRRVLLVSQGSP